MFQQFGRQGAKMFFNIGFKTETNKNKVLVLGSNQVSFSNGILKVNILTDKNFYIDAKKGGFRKTTIEFRLV